MDTKPNSVQVCGLRYAQRRNAGKAGWADESAYEMFQHTLDDILACGHLSGSIRFLELGCGNGNLTLYMAGKGHEAYGMDIVPEAIEWANQNSRERQIPPRFTVGSVVTLSPYADGFFNLVFDANCLFMITGKEDRKECVRNVFRVLAKGGLFYAEAHLVNEDIKTRTKYVGDDYFDPQGQYSTAQGQPMYYYSREQEFIDLIEGAGFQIIRQTKTPPLPDYPVFCSSDIWLVASKP